MNLDQILARPDVWQGRPAETGASRERTLPTGFAALDAELPGGGWPASAMTELLIDTKAPATQGFGEFTLLMPSLAQLGRGNQWVVLIAPPYPPYAPALASAGIELSRLLLIQPPQARDALWAAEQCLRNQACGAVVLWTHSEDLTVLRRLQLAADAGDTRLFAYRPAAQARAPSPAVLRLQLQPTPDGLQIEILKRRAGRARQPVELPMRHAVA